jgi:hypothetical protein
MLACSAYATHTLPSPATSPEARAQRLDYTLRCAMLAGTTTAALVFCLHTAEWITAQTLGRSAAVLCILVGGALLAERQAEWRAWKKALQCPPFVAAVQIHEVLRQGTRRRPRANALLQSHWP